MNEALARSFFAGGRIFSLPPVRTILVVQFIQLVSIRLRNLGGHTSNPICAASPFLCLCF